MISKQTQVSFIISQSRTPTIISPKNDFQWSNNRSINFQWRYNGEDIQFQYQIEIIKTKIESRSQISTVLSSYKANPSLFDVYSYSAYGNEQNIVLNLSSDITEDGIYIWRIRTKGTLARDWSEWAEDGLVRTDESAPYIRNVSALTKSPVGELASSISDLSSPYTYTDRSYGLSTVKDRHIDRNGQPGLYIYYDYRDNSINIRAQTGKSTSSKRYYGMISFHEDATALTKVYGTGSNRVYDPKYSIQNLVKSIYQYSINKEENSLGPFDNVRADEIFEDGIGGKRIFPSLHQIIHAGNIDDPATEKFVPKGFPTFFDTTVYQNQGFTNHPLGFEATENFVTPYPMYSRRFRQRRYQFSGESIITLTSVPGQEYVEVRYPSPYQDFFLIFRQTGIGSNALDLICYGQYSESDVKKLMNEERNQPFNDLLIPLRGFSVIQNRADRTKPDDEENLLFPTSNTSLYFRSNLGVVKHEDYMNPSNLSEDNIYNISPYSYQIFFNLNATFNEDQAVKIYLREETLQFVEYMENIRKLGFDPTYQVPFPYVEFNFRPDSDCTSVFITENNLGQPISLDEIFIGRAKISPRDLSMYNANPTDKKVFKDIKIQYEESDSDTIETVTGWGPEETYFNNDFTKYNGSIRLQIPNFEFIPYYHYNTAYDNIGSTNPVPHIYNANPNPNTDNTINWDSIVVKSAKANETEKDLYIIKDMLYKSDFIRFNNTSKFLGQIHPFLYNIAAWNVKSGESIFGKGKILKFRSYYGNGLINDSASLSYHSQTIYEAGLDTEFIYPVTYNQIDRGIFGIADLEDGSESNTTNLYIKDFSNHIFRKSVRVDIEEAISSSSRIANSIYPSNHLSHNRTFVWDGTNIETENVQISGDSNGPSWIFNAEENNKDQLIFALISADASAQGFYNSISWARSNSIGFSGLYLIYEDSATPELLNEQIERSILGYDSLERESYFIRSKIQNNNIPIVNSDIDADLNAYISGDTFEIGNIFGYIYPSDNNIIKFFFDVDESVSGIDSIKYLEVDIPVELATGDSEDEISSPHYFGIESSGKPSKIPIKIQKFNSETYNYNPLSMSLSDDIFDEIRSSRSPLDAVEYYLDNSPDVRYMSLNSSDVLDLPTSTTDYKFKRFTYSLSASGGGFKIFFFKIKDKAGNESNVYSVPFYLQGSNTITVANDIVSATIAADDSLVISEETKTLFGSNHEFLTNLLPTDTRNNRSVVIRDILTDDGLGNLINHPYINDLLIGFSDSYGLNYNVYSPISAITTWNFKRPVYVRIKSFNSGFKGPDWYFDPNDVRHYVPDTSEDYALGVGENNNVINIQNFHIPVNPGTTGRTLLGFLDENVENYARSNAMVRKIYENKEEFIGKSLVIGSVNELSFRILDIFKSDNLSPAKRFNTSGEITTNYSADADGGVSSGEQPREKIWIVIEDDEAIAALILSRKFQYITEDLTRLYDICKNNTGWRNSILDTFSEDNYVENFGYYPEESEISSSVNTLVNQALRITTNITTDPDDLVAGDNQVPTAFEGSADHYIYFDASSFDDTSSGIPSNEGWTTRIYQGYSHTGAGDVPQAVLDKLRHHQLLGINYYNKMVFGEPYNVDVKISKVSYNAVNDETYILLSETGVDYTMRNLSYKIYDSSNNEISLGSFQQEIKNIAVDGDVMSTYGSNVYDALGPYDSEGAPSSDNYTLRITIDGLDYIDETTGTPYSRGWWPKVDGLLVPPIDQKIGSSSTLWNLSQIKFAIISTGSFYIPKDGEYSFKIEKDPFSYADFSIDFPGVDVDRYVEYNGEYVEKTTSISFAATTGSESNEKSVYLLKGWHTARFRCRVDNSAFDSSYTNYLRLLYSKPGWEDSEGEKFYVPLIGSRNEDMNFMSRAYKSVFGRIIDKDFNRYPKEQWEIAPDETFNREASLLRAVVGFRQSPIVDEISTFYNYQALKVTRSTGDNSKPAIAATSPAEVRPTYGAEILEEAQAIYTSNIFDGGTDFRFWRSISWTPTPEGQPDGTSVEFEIRTGSSEADLLSKSWNNIGTETDPEILAPFIQPGQDLIDFSQVSVNTNNEIILKRFIQFRMTLKSTVKNVTPTVDDVTIVYSKQNSVNFFTTTFNLTSNIVRSILTYNGNIPTSPSGVALSEIQFGICTEEDVNGKVVTNFDRYTIIPTDEAFSLASLGVQENDKFRIGIRFVSTEGSIPTVDEFALMWETDGKRDQVKDLISRVDNG